MVYCAALHCQNATSGTSKPSSVTFYEFPWQNQALLRRWVQNMGGDVATPSKHQRLCSDHFEESSFERDPLKVHKNRRLLKEAVPNRFILGEDGTWLVGTPQSFSGVLRNKTRKQIQAPQRWRVSGKFLSGADGPTLEDWQNEFYKTILKENCGSLTTLGKDHTVSKSKIPVGKATQLKDEQDLEGGKIPASLGTGHGGAMIRSQLQSGEDRQVRGSSSGGSQNLRWNFSGKGETSESPRNPTNRANPVGSRRSRSFPAKGQVAESKRCLVQQRSPGQTPKVPWFICTDCGKSFARHASLLRHRKIHSEGREHACPECGESFLEKSKLAHHLKARLHIIRVSNAFLG